MIDRSGSEGRFSARPPRAVIARGREVRYEPIARLDPRQPLDGVQLVRLPVRLPAAVPPLLRRRAREAEEPRRPAGELPLLHLELAHDRGTAAAELAPRLRPQLAVRAPGPAASLRALHR